MAIARAVVGEHRLLLADEPSGALDSANGEAVMRLIHAACQRGMAAVVTTHDAQLASWADRVVFLRDGRVADQTAAAGRSRAAAGTSPVSAATITSRPDRAGTGNGGVPARRAVIRWAWRLFRRQWRQQLLVLGLLTVAVAATIWGIGVATNTPPPAHRDLRHRHRRDQPAGHRPAPSRRDRTDRQELRPDRRDREPGP